MERKFKTGDEARLHCINVAVREGFNVEDDPEAAPWLKEGVRIVQSGKKVSIEDLREIDRSNGTGDI